MIHYYTNREVANILELNLARWKRWSRAFLPPDPLGGMQSGYARQYLFKDIFKVYLGGHLLSHHKLGIPESRQVLSDLSAWLKKTGFFDLNGGNGNLPGNGTAAAAVLIYFSPIPSADAKGRTAFDYLIQRFTDESWHGGECAGILAEGPGGVKADGRAFFTNPRIYLINISALRSTLIERLQDQP